MTCYALCSRLAEFLNLARLIAGIFLPTWNLIYAFDWSLVWVAVRVLIDCTLVEGPLVLEQFGEDLGIALELLMIALGDFISDPNFITTATLDLVPFVEQLGVTANTTAQLLDCGCNAFNWTFAAIFSLVSDPALGMVVNSTANAGISVLQAFSLSIMTPQFPQINVTIADLQTALLNVGDLAQAVLIVAFDTAFNIVTLGSTISVIALTPGRYGS